MNVQQRTNSLGLYADIDKPGNTSFALATKIVTNEKMKPQYMFFFRNTFISLKCSSFVLKEQVIMFILFTKKGNCTIKKLQLY